MNPEELKAQLREAMAQAKAALGAAEPDVAQAQTWRKKAEHIKSVMEEYAALEGVLPAAKSTRPPLPGTSKSAGFVPVDGDGEEAAPATSDERAGIVSKAVYNTRFGTPDAAAAQVLKELYPTGAERMFMTQKSAFNKYLRKGEKALNREEHSSLKTVVLSPGMIDEAFLKSIDVATMKAALVEAIDTLGGYTVPVDFQARIIQRIKGATVVRGRASAGQTSRDVVELPTIVTDDTTNHQYTSAVRVSWVDETPTSPGATNFTVGMESIPIHTSMAETYLSRNLIEDTQFDIESWVAEKFAEASAIDEDNKFLTGLGIGSPQGILPNGLNVLGLTQKVSGGASTLTWDGLISMVYSIPSQYRQGAVWTMNRSTVEAIQKLKSGDQYLWQPYQYAGGTGGNGAPGQPINLLGFQVLEQEIMPDIAANSFPILFGDYRGYQIFDRVGMTVERFLDSGTARNNQILFVMRRRLGGQPLETWRFATQKVAAS